MGYLVIVTVLGWTRCSLDQVFIIIIEGCCWGSVLSRKRQRSMYQYRTAPENCIVVIL